ncbi:hypothetical protein C365_02749 [Cryptococcus neoformans Bt85]|nr:hypothetical protein C365_02749 [Cryptococcus neoformans var. grubii Bt85]
MLEEIFTSWQEYLNYQSIMSSGTPLMNSKLFISNTFLYTMFSDAVFAAATRNPGVHQAVSHPNTCTAILINIFLIWQQQNFKLL